MSVYNSEKTIEKTIFSVLNQSFKSYEFIIVNDGSQDNTKKILEKYKNKNKNKIKIYNFKKNIGLATRLNFAMNKAQYSYIVRIDDVYGDNYVEQYWFDPLNPNNNNEQMKTLNLRNCIQIQNQRLEKILENDSFKLEF